MLSEQDPGKQVKHLTGGNGAKAVVVTATASAAYQTAFEMLGPFGTLMCVSILPEEAKVWFHPLWFIDNGWTIKGSSVGTRADILEALEFVNRGLVTPQIKWAHLEDLGKLMGEMSKGQASPSHTAIRPHANIVSLCCDSSRGSTASNYSPAEEDSAFRRLYLFSEIFELNYYIVFYI